MKYIDADLLRKRIEKNKYVIEPMFAKGDDCYYEGEYDGYNHILDIIKSLQQEQSEVDLEEEISTWIPAHIRGGDNEVWKDTKNAVTEWGGIVARHFYELGKNARKV